MLLRNYDNLMAITALPKKDASNQLSGFPQSEYSDGSILLKNSDGALGLMYGSTAPVYPVPFSRIGQAPTETGYTLFSTGSNGTAASYEDHRVDYIGPASLTLSMENPTYDQTTKAYKRKISFTLTYGSTEKTIREYGFFIHVSYWQGASTSAGTKDVYVYREALEDPVVVQPNASVVFTFEISTPANGSKPSITLDSVG